MRDLIALLVVAAMILSTGTAQADLGDQLFKLLPDDGVAYDWFSYSVAMSEQTAIIGAWRDDDNGDLSGSAASDIILDWIAEVGQRVCR